MEITLHIFSIQELLFLCCEIQSVFKGFFLSGQKCIITKLGASIVSEVAMALDECFQQKLKEIMSL